MRPLDEIRAGADAASPGPWEAGHVWYRAGLCYEGGKRVLDSAVATATECAFCHMGPPVFVDPAMDINGHKMPGHIHHSNDPHDVEHTISGADYTVVLVGRDDYDANVGEADAAFMRHARTDVPDLLELVECLAADNERLTAARAAVRKATALVIAAEIKTQALDVSLVGLGQSRDSIDNHVAGLEAAAQIARQYAETEA